MAAKYDTTLVLLSNDDQPVQFKICSTCHILKAEDDFYVKNKSKNPLKRAAHCKSCHRAAMRIVDAERMAANPDKVRQLGRERQKRSYARNPENHTQASRKYRTLHSEKVRQYKKHYRLIQKDAIAAYMLQYRCEHAQDIRAQRCLYTPQYYVRHGVHIRRTSRAYKKTHPEIAQTSKNRRRARKASAPINDLSVAQWQEILEAFEYRCAYCHRKMARLTQEHLTPVVKHGSFTLHNIVPACQSCNSKKNVGPVLSPVQPLLLTVAPAKKRKKP